jgi:DNA polymerase elongation subunit (family B)
LNQAKLFNSIFVNAEKLYSDYVFLDARTSIKSVFARASDIKKPSVFSLNALSEILLNDTKVQHVNIVAAWKTDYKLLSQYVAKDVDLLKRLCYKTKILQMYVDRLNFVKVRLDKVNVNSYVLDVVVRRLNKDKVFPTKKWHEGDFEVKGAIVLEPKQGIYKDVGVFDFSCLTKNTKILMSDYTEKNIEDLKIGDRIRGLNNDAIIKNLNTQHTNKVYRITLKSGTVLTATGNHRFFKLAADKKPVLTSVSSLFVGNKLYKRIELCKNDI